MIKKYESVSTHLIPGRGTVIVVNIPLEDDLPQIQEDVMIDKKRYTVIGIEMARGIERMPHVGLNIRSKK